MFKKRLTWIVIGLAVLVLAGSGAALAASRTQAKMGPTQVTQAYYDWYLSYLGDRATGELHNPLVDGAYKDSPYLSPAFMAEVEQTVAGFDKGGFDPFLCAQDIPTSVTAGEAVIEGSEATVPVQTSFEGHTFTARLALMEGQWKITGIARQ